MRLVDTLCPWMMVRAARGLQGSQSVALARYKDCMKGAGCLSLLRGDDHRRMCRAELASPATARTGDPQRHVGRPNRPGKCETRPRRGESGRGEAADAQLSGGLSRAQPTESVAACVTLLRCRILGVGGQKSCSDSPAAFNFGSHTLSRCLNFILYFFSWGASNLA